MYTNEQAKDLFNTIVDTNSYDEGVEALHIVLDVAMLKGAKQAFIAIAAFALAKVREIDIAVLGEGDTEPTQEVPGAEAAR